MNEVNQTTLILSPDKAYDAEQRYRVVKRSIDARQRALKVHLTVLTDEQGNPLPKDAPIPLYEPPVFQDVHHAKHSAAIIGAGPAGLFAALTLLEHGIKPIIYERGKPVSDRKKDIAILNRNQGLNAESNYCFGEGGAGTFSDGKLYSRSKKRGNMQRVMELFHHFGANDTILYEAHAHIGSDRLPSIIRAMRECIIEHGGEVHFDTCVDEQLFRSLVASSPHRHNATILAIGHSAHDTYQMLLNSGVALADKGFAMGVRVEHPQALINRLMYHDPSPELIQLIGNASYSLVTQVQGRGMYSFCMCPGGHIVPAGSDARGCVVNGMSASHRNSPFANSGMVVEIRPEDLLQYPIIRTFNVIAGGQQGGISGEATADVELYGYDFETTDRVAQEIKAKMYEIEGVKQVKISRDEYIPEYAVDFDREKLAVNGLNVQTASLYVRNRINGALASYYREDGDEYDIRVRLDPKFRQTIEDIENIVIYNAAGKGIYVRDLGKVREMQTPPTIERKDRERVITISAVVPKGMAASDLINAVSEKMEEVDMPAGLSWIFGGTMDDQNDTYSELITLLVLIVILVFIVMAAQFESLTYPFVIMFSIPFAIIGVLLGLVINGTPMSVMAMVGLIMLMGIVVKNGIVLIDYTILCRERGMGVLHSVVTAGKSRLRPVLMTTLTTVLGMIPMAVGRGEGSEMWRGLGMTVAWGLSVSTLITLVLIPTLYAAFAGRGIKRARKASNKKARAAAALAE